MHTVSRSREAGLEAYQHAVADVAKALGGQTFAYCAAVHVAADLMNRRVALRVSDVHAWTHAAQQLWLLATPEEIGDATRDLWRHFRRSTQTTAVYQSATVQGGVLALRGDDLMFETDEACAVVAQSLQLGSREWKVGLTQKGEMLLSSIGRRRPRATGESVADQISGRSELVRLAAHVFDRPLRATENSGVASPRALWRAEPVRTLA
ncbi:hypothetical protein [Burkholderia sp. MBR-1]|uniref:hypothetical protein n=1 Tax=Burkholderia sp. MBR-1 TaxID=2732364 RepID=UPI0015EE3D3E|nr:hypothetical protein [Burkholderia sp. MBR-1]QMI49933.1 hypothetical protein MBR110_31235 [Burkholderia sp. MBR-1]